MIFGGVLALCTLPPLIGGLLSGGDAGVLPGARIASVLAASTLFTLGIAMLTWRYRVTVDGPAGTITWTRHTLGFSWTSATWRREEIQAIELVHFRGRSPGYRILARAKTRRRVLHERPGSSEPMLAHEIADLLHLPLARPER